MPARKKKQQAELSKVEEELSSLTVDELRKALKEAGEQVGPIDLSNKGIYVRMLARKKLRHTSELETPQKGPEKIPGLATVLSPLSGGRGGGGGGGGDSDAGTSPRLVRKPLSNPGLTPRSGTKRPATSNPSAAGFDTPSSSKKKARPMLAVCPQKSTFLNIRDFKVVGLTAATFTPFSPDGELNLSMIRQYVDWLLNCGVMNIFLNGTTGESMSLTVEERKLLLEEWNSVAAGRLTIVAHVGTENLKNTCELAEHAQENGAAAIGVMPTTFFKPSTIDHLITYLQKVAESAPRLPMYYYHIPSMTGVNFSMEALLDKAGSCLPTLRGIKYTDTNLFEFGRCVTNQSEKYQIIYGSDEQLIGALALGGTAAIGSTYNYAGKLYNRLLHAYQRRDTEAAMLEQRRSQAMIKLLFKYGAHPGGGKAFLRLCSGIDCGPPRLPFLPLSEQDVKSLESDLTDMGFFEWS